MFVRHFSLMPKRKKKEKQISAFKHSPVLHFAFLNVKQTNKTNERTKREHQSSHQNVLRVCCDERAGVSYIFAVFSSNSRCRLSVIFCADLIQFVRQTSFGFCLSHRNTTSNITNFNHAHTSFAY